MPRRKRVVCIGGGTGQSQILRALSRRPINLTAVVGVTDDGGHSGILRKIFSIPQVGDIRNCLAALGDDNDPLTWLLRYRFQEGDLEGVSLGNLIVTALLRMKGSLSGAIDALAKQLRVRARILPVSDASTQICAELRDGRTVRGEWAIIRRKPRSPIRRLFHHPEVECHPGAARALALADLIVFCPGSLQTGILSALLTGGIRTAIRGSRATKVQICNIMTQPGNTDGFTARDHLELLTLHLGVAPDVLLVNTGRPPQSWLKPYRKEGARPVRVDVGGNKAIRIIRGDYLEPKGKDVTTLYARAGLRHAAAAPAAGPHSIRHDPEKIGRALFALLRARSTT